MSSAAEGRSIRNASRIAALEAQVRVLNTRVEALEGTAPPAPAGASSDRAPAADAQSHPPQTTNWVDAVKRIAATPEEIEAASSPPRMAPPPTTTIFDSASSVSVDEASSIQRDAQTRPGRNHPPNTRPSSRPPPSRKRPPSNRSATHFATRSHATMKTPAHAPSHSSASSSRASPAPLFSSSP